MQGAGVLKTLLDRKLIATAGRKTVLGKPILYKTTKEFLVQFGLKDLSELPTLKEFEELGRLSMGDEPRAAKRPAERPAGSPDPPRRTGAAKPPGNRGINARRTATEAAGARRESPAGAKPSN